MVVDLINQGVDALILNPINANSIVPVVQQAQKKGIPVSRRLVRAVSGQLS
jgi:ribose transport system substrate-binding protein